MRVLVVDDEVKLAAAIARRLRAEGIDVDVSHDGRDGLWRATEGSYDAIVLDIMLPGLNGYQVCARLREQDVWTPILMLTAKDGEYDEAEGLETGADDYLGKPFSFVVLIARLRALVRRGAAARPSTLMVDDLSLDPATHRCVRADTAIGLTPREHAVLEVLMRNAGDVVSKQRLVDHVWGIDHEGDVNVVEVYVGYLRKKIDQPFDRPLIHTVRGFGYRLAAEGLVEETVKGVQR